MILVKEQKLYTGGLKLWPIIVILQSEEDSNTVVEAERGIMEKLLELGYGIREM